MRNQSLMQVAVALLFAAAAVRAESRTVLIQIKKGSGGKTVVAIYLLAVGITGLQLLGLQSWIVDVFNGACLIVAVGFTRLLRAST